MRRFASLAVVLLLATSSLAAQSVWFGGGVSIPTGDYGNYAKTGWMATAGIGFPVGQTKALSIGVEGLFGSNTHSDVTGDKTTLYGALVGPTYHIGNLEKPHLYVFASGGFLVHKYSSDQFPSDEGSDTKFAYEFGAGLDIPLEKIGLWADVRYLARAESGATATIPIMAGIYIPLKK
jgi:opacity protein-like surface antigen